MAKTSKAKITDSDIVQRKLSDVATTFNVEVPWSAYEQYASYLLSTLSDEGVDIELDDLIMNESVLKMFEKRVFTLAQDYTSDALITDVTDDCYGDAYKLFSKEMREAKEKREAERLARENSKEALVKEMVHDGLILAVTAKNRPKAFAILKAAGLI